ncbi:transcription termination factor MTERF5, chloroplastic-like [Macadamia integrifolia]|uniref:transcription termination factor MTERF5, chloroplastic-like n=1 Tax=Macadamia integrifolia TaxID=60698 RepID=UPI001C4E893D|nr:transcription termination factor MTERF5, chloroplastic-like [Macadamia integrifolia]
MIGSGLGLGLRLLNRRFGSETGFQIRIILSVYDLPLSDFYCTPSIISNLSFSCFSSVASPAKSSDSNPFIVDYLVEAFGLSKTQALAASKLRMGMKDSKKPESVVHFLRQLGFSEAHVRGAVRVSPQILFSKIEKTLKPKLKLFQEIGLTGSDLGRFISKNAGLLTVSLDRRLIPCMEVLKKMFTIYGGHRSLILVLQRCKWVLTSDPEARLLPNISLLESHGIVGSQLSALFRRQPTLFLMRESALRDQLRRVVEMGVSADSRMFVHALHTISCMSPETLRGKFELFQGFGFSEEECMTMFEKMPVLFRCSEVKLKFGIEFFMNVIGFEKMVLVQRPMCLMYSIEKRVIPRYRVIEILKSKRLLKKVPIFLHVVELPEKKFVDRFISRFKDDLEELLVAYKGAVLDSSEEDEST